MSSVPASHDIGFAVSAMGGRVIAAGSSARFAGAAADSRQVKRGQMFFALPGERVDGFSFVEQAAAAGAAAVVVQDGRGPPAGAAGATIIAVREPRAALGALALAVRQRFAGLVVGVTGSNGKTTTKELIAAALGPLGPVMRTAGNLNTDVGLPLTILSATGHEAAWVLEMAMRARGEIAYLARIGKPRIGVITNVAGAHLERLGSLEEVARAKGELYFGLPPDGIAVLPGDEPLVEGQAQEAAIPETRRLRFGAGGGVDVRVLEVIPAGAAGAVVRYAVRDLPVVVRLPLPGLHNARNGAAALAVALAAGVPALAAARALESLALPPHRSAVIEAGGRTVLDDCYNANPASMRAALQALLASVGSGRPFAILGDMLELGPEAETLHRQIGAEAAGRLAGLCGVGPLASALVQAARAAGLPPARAVTAATPDEAGALVAPWTQPGDWILVKGSRGMKLEAAVAALQRHLSGGADPATRTA
ncbi:MAG TPA: UDP-N-acetylmuramoyl-tripeptide--D-alanyl-D-alanine ligase [Polyangia bacterium]|nr:UDP-N-acetylmuramoyl-tripeptide--D-alanyl-D-alanine ligase [Polyangia bacterium]